MDPSIKSSRHRVYGGFLSVDEVTVTVGEKPALTRQVVERGDAVGVLLCLPSEDQFVFVRQLRVPTIRHGEPWLTEIVAGTIDDGEGPEDAARREITEETGFVVDRLESLGEMYGSPGGLSEKVWIFGAVVHQETRVHPGGGIDDEQIEVVFMNQGEAYPLLDAGGFRDAKTQIALLKWRQRFDASQS